MNLFTYRWAPSGFVLKGEVASFSRVKAENLLTNLGFEPFKCICTISLDY
jgi:hypothetical protein